MKYEREQLEKIGIHSLCIIAREIGVKCPTSLTKSELINEILLIQSGEKQPCPPTKKGRPVKNTITSIIIDSKKKEELIDYILKEVKIKLYEIL